MLCLRSRLCEVGRSHSLGLSSLRQITLEALLERHDLSTKTVTVNLIPRKIKISCLTFFGGAEPTCTLEQCWNDKQGRRSRS